MSCFLLPSPKMRVSSSVIILKFEALEFYFIKVWMLGWMEVRKIHLKRTKLET